MKIDLYVTAVRYPTAQFEEVYYSKEPITNELYGTDGVEIFSWRTSVDPKTYDALMALDETNTDHPIMEFLKAFLVGSFRAGQLYVESKDE